jgi:hypothetical protein
MDFQFPKLRHEDQLREAEINRQVKVSRATGKRRAGWSSALAWELRRHRSPPQDPENLEECRLGMGQGGQGMARAGD